MILESTFTEKVVNLWNSLLSLVVEALLLNCFKMQLDKFWCNQDVLCDFKAPFFGMECDCIMDYWATTCKTVRPMLSGHCPVCPVCPVCNVGIMAGWLKMKLGMEVGLSPSHIVLDGDPAPPKGAQPQFYGPCPLWMD